MTTEEKAQKYDELASIVAAFYPDNEGEMTEDEIEQLGNLSELGEKIAMFFGYI